MNEIELLKSKETSIINDNLLFKQDNKGYLEKIINLEQELSTLKINRSQLNESIKNECNDLEKLLKEKDVESTNLNTHLKEVESLAFKGDEIPTLYDKIKLLRNDLSNCEETKKVFESQVIALRKVEKSKYVLEEENRTFIDNIVSLDRRFSELEGLVLKYNNHKSELATDIENLTIKYDGYQSKCEEVSAMISKHNIEINALGVFAAELQKKQLSNEEEITRLGHDINRMTKILDLKENEINSASTESFCIVKELLLLNEKKQKLETDLDILNRSNETKLKNKNENKSEINKMTSIKDEMASSLAEKDDLISRINASISDFEANMNVLEKKIHNTASEKESLSKSIDSLILNLGDKKIQLQLEEDRSNGMKLDLSKILKENM